MLTVKVLGKLPRQGWPRGPFPIAALQSRGIDIVIKRDPKSSLTEELWQKGYTGMENPGRSAWLEDFRAGYFQILAPNSGEHASNSDERLEQGDDVSGLREGAQASGSGSGAGNDENVEGRSGPEALTLGSINVDAGVMGT